jgi:F-type H+-transporting ATPase subunit epsilon
MAGTFKFELVCPEQVLISEDAEQVVLPGSEGDFAVLAGHAPVIATLRPGVLDIQLPGKKRHIYVSGGVAEVEPARLTVLAPRTLDGEQVDAAKVATEQKLAEAELALAKGDEPRRLALEAVERLKGFGPR